MYTYCRLCMYHSGKFNFTAKCYTFKYYECRILCFVVSASLRNLVNRTNLVHNKYPRILSKIVCQVGSIYKITNAIYHILVVFSVAPCMLPYLL
jgi:hypothetical protein